MAAIHDIQQEIVEEFELFDDWTDKYAYIIDLGKQLPPMAEEHKSEETRIHGCQSNVWVYPELSDAVLHLEGDSESAIVKGLVAMVLRVWNGQPPQEVAQSDLEFIENIGLKQHLSSTRSNGLASMIKQIQRYAGERAAAS